MTEQEILQYNKRCAEFLGWEFQPVTALHNFTEGSWKDKEGNYHFEWVKFHSDWNWIMEVVEAIEQLHFNVRMSCTCITIENAFDNDSNLKPIHKFHSIQGEFETKKEATINAINQFLIWYNEINRSKQNSSL